MANFELDGIDQPLQPTPPATAKPGTPSKVVPTQAGNANDSGALWWDHDDPGQPGSRGAGGAFGIPSAPGPDGGATPPGVRFTISETINGAFSILLHGGRGQIGGKAGPGGDGGDLGGGGPGGKAGDNGPRQINGNPGPLGARGPQGADGFIDTIRIVA